MALCEIWLSKFWLRYDITGLWYMMLSGMLGFFPNELHSIEVVLNQLCRLVRGVSTFYAPCQHALFNIVINRIV